MVALAQTNAPSAWPFDKLRMGPSATDAPSASGRRSG